MYPNLNSKNNIASMGQFPRLTEVRRARSKAYLTGDLRGSKEGNCDGPWFEMLTYISPLNGMNKLGQNSSL